MDSGLAMSSSDLRSVATPRTISTMPPTTIAPAAMRYPINRLVVCAAFPIRWPYRTGPRAPKHCAIAKNTAMACARTSSGKTSLTVR